MRLTAMAVCFMAATAFFACYAGWEAIIIKAQSDANRAMPHALMCFGYDGQPSRGERDWKECRDVQYRVVPAIWDQGR